MRIHPALPAFVALVSFASPLAAQGAAPQSPADTAAAVVSWVRQHAVPLRYVEAGHGFADLQPLKRVWRDAQVVGLGEATHGTREFYQVKHRLIEFLVRELGFTAVVFESSFSNCQRINDYVLHGRGSRDSALTRQGWVVFDIEEMRALIDWMRTYNRTVPDERKVRFLGMDVYWNEVGEAKVLAYLRRIAPERAAAADSIFRVIAREEAKRPVQDTAALAAVRPGLKGLAAFFDQRRDSLGAGGLEPALDSARQHVEVMLRATVPGARRTAMGENFAWIVEHERPGTKFVLWAYDGHLAGSSADTAEHTVGLRARELFGDRYYAVATAFNEGSYQTRVMPPNEPARELKAVIAPPAPVGSLPWHLARARVGNLFLDLRPEPADPLVRAWVNAPQQTQGLGWRNADHAESYRPVLFRGPFDGIVFIERTTPTRPTPTGKQNVANRVRM